MDELDLQCQPIICNNKKSLNIYYKTAENLYNIADSTIINNDLISTYVYLKRFINLFLITIPQHNDYNAAIFKPEKLKFKELCKKALNKLEEIKPICIDMLMNQSEDQIVDSSTPESKTFNDKSVAPLPSILPVNESCCGNHSNSTDHISNKNEINHNIDISSIKNEVNVIEPSALKELSLFTRIASTNTITSLNANKSNCSYPSVPNGPLNSVMGNPKIQPALLPTYSKQVSISSPVLSPINNNLNTFTSVSPNSKLAATAPVTILPPDNSIVRPLLNLKKIITPRRLPSMFLEYAYNNTKNNVETCAVLAGKLIDNCFRITTLILPKQEGSANTVVTSSEEEMGMIQIERDLLTLGWIHTHPSQEAFLSSVDMHTQYSYQIMINEAIAIVCAPTYNRIEAFSLSSKGLNILKVFLLNFNYNNCVGLQLPWISST